MDCVGDDLLGVVVGVWFVGGWCGVVNVGGGGLVVGVVVVC